MFPPIRRKARNLYSLSLHHLDVPRLHQGKGDVPPRHRGVGIGAPDLPFFLSSHTTPRSSMSPDGHARSPSRGGRFIRRPLETSGKPPDTSAFPTAAYGGRAAFSGEACRPSLQPPPEALSFPGARPGASPAVLTDGHPILWKRVPSGSHHGDPPAVWRASGPASPHPRLEPTVGPARDLPRSAVSVFAARRAPSAPEGDRRRSIMKGVDCHLSGSSRTAFSGFSR